MSHSFLHHGYPWFRINYKFDPFCHRADSRFAPSQWETSLQSNAVSHWLGANPESALNYIHIKQTSLQTSCGDTCLIHLIFIKGIPIPAEMGVYTEVASEEPEMCPKSPVQSLPQTFLDMQCMSHDYPSPACPEPQPPICPIPRQFQPNDNKRPSSPSKAVAMWLLFQPISSSHHPKDNLIS